MPISSQPHHRLRRHDPPRCSQRRLLFFLLKCVIMAAVISLFLFFLGFAAIVFLHFLFMSSAFHRDRTTTHGGESRKVQALLHDVVYRDVGRLSEASDCAICLDSFVDGECCRNIPACKHMFHSECVDRWIRKQPTCPVCRSPVEMNPDGSNGVESGGSDTWKRLWDGNFHGTSH